MSLPVFAFSDVHPAQMGDQGGAFAAELEMQFRQKNRGASYGQAYIPVTDDFGRDLMFFLPGEADNLYSFYLNEDERLDGNESWDEEVFLEDDFEPEPWVAYTAHTSVNGFFPHLGFVLDPRFVVAGGLPQYDFKLDGGPMIPGVGDDDGDPSQLPGALEEEPIKASGVQALDWFKGGADLLKNNKNLRIFDTKTGTSWNARYINGANHADIIPASQSDATLIKNKKITGSYERRPVVVTIGGTQYAGSMYAIGHGSTSYCSYFKGVMCIHFTGSMTHGTKKVDAGHQNAISEALKSGGGY